MKIKGASLENSIPGPGKADEDYQNESNLGTMHAAAKIAADPVALKQVHKLAGRRHKALTGMIEPMLKPAKKSIKSLDDLKAVANKDNSGMGSDSEDV